MAGSPLAAPWQAGSPGEAALTATAQLMLFKPGVYAVALHVAQSSPTDIGVPLPSVRLDPLPPAAGAEGRAFVSMAAEGGWLSRASDKVFILVAGGTARVILTIYKAGPDATAPEIRINNVTQDALAPAPPPPPRPPAPAAKPTPAAPGEVALRVAAHSTAGRVMEALHGGWAGEAGSTLEGFLIDAAGELESGFDYQAIIGVDWDTPWSRAGSFCGSRGLSLALLGFRVRLGPACAATHQCTYWGRFKDGGTAGPFSSGEACVLDGSELEAIRVVILRRELAASTDKAPAAAPAPLAKAQRSRRKLA